MDCIGFDLAFVYNGYGDNMDGILVLNKETNMSSHDCVNQVRMALDTRKVGHAGTLDVAASGVLVLGVNKGTKIMQYLNQDNKTYEFSVAFNQETDTLDHTGKVTLEKQVEDFSKLEEVLATFIGSYEQIPPSYSAVKVKGKKLYEYARKNQPIPEVKPRKTTIYKLEKTSELRKIDGLPAIDLKVSCSKGLYVRQLALDIAKKLGTVAHTTRIHRTQSGRFTLDDAFKMEDLKRGAIELIGLNDALEGFSSVLATDAMVKRITHGQKLNLDAHAEIIKLIDKDKTLLAIYEKTDKKLYKPTRVFI